MTLYITNPPPHLKHRVRKPLETLTYFHHSLCSMMTAGKDDVLRSVVLYEEYLLTIPAGGVVSDAKGDSLSYLCAVSRKRQYPIGAGLVMRSATLSTAIYKAIGDFYVIVGHTRQCMAISIL